MKKYKLLKHILYLSPLIFGVLVLLTYLKEMLFFSFWGIKIADYLSFSEILTSSIDDFIYFLIMLTVCSVGFLPFIIRVVLKNKISPKKYKKLKIPKKLKIYHDLLWLFLFNVLLLLLLKECSYFKFLHLQYGLPLIQIPFIILIWLKHKGNITANNVLIAFVVSMFLSTIYFASISGYTKKNVRAFDDNYIYQVAANGKILKNDQDSYIIRLTSEYLFFYDSTMVKVYPMSKVECIKLKGH